MRTAKTQSYMSVITEDIDGNFNVIFPDFPGCVTCGRTFEEARNNASEALSLWIEEMQSQQKKKTPNGRKVSYSKNTSLVPVTV